MTQPAATLNPNEVMVGTANGAGLWIAPEGTPLPVDGAAFTAPWAPLGYASDDGPTLSGDTSTESITPWQSRVPIRTVITERTQTVAFVLWQLNQHTLSLYFDADVPAPNAEGVIEFDVRSDSAGHIHAIAVDARDGDSIFRAGYTRASLDSVGDMQLTKGAAVPLDVTLSALDDNGVLAHVYVKVGGVGQTLVVHTNPAGPTGADISADLSGGSTAPAPEANQPAADQPAPDDAGVGTGPATDLAKTGDTSTGDTGDTSGSAS